MRRRHKITYCVQDWGTTNFWWNRGDWRKPVDVPGSDRIHFLVGTEIKRVGAGGASSSKRVFTLRSAMYWARRLKAKGGTPLITRKVIRNGKPQFHEWSLR